MIENILEIKSKKQLKPILKEHIQWIDELKRSYKFCIEFGLDLELSFHAYEVAIVKGYDARILIYPHKVSSTRNIHLRVREAGSKNKFNAQIIMDVLSKWSGKPPPFEIAYFCTFTQNNRGIIAEKDYNYSLGMLNKLKEENKQ